MACDAALVARDTVDVVGGEQSAGAALTSKRTPVPVLFALFVLGFGVACGGAGTETAASAPVPTLAAHSEATAVSPSSTATAASPTARATSVDGVIGDDDGIRVPESSVASGPARMITIVDDEDVQLRNGGQVLLSDDLTVELFVDPYPPSTLRVWLDVYLTDGGSPVLDAEILVDYEMLSMEHGPFSSEAQNVGGGHYLFTLDYLMYGAWEQTVRVKARDRSLRVPLLLLVAP